MCPGPGAADKVRSPETREQAAAWPRRKASDFRAFPSSRFAAQTAQTPQSGVCHQSGGRGAIAPAPPQVWGVGREAGGGSPRGSGAAGHTPGGGGGAPRPPPPQGFGSRTVSRVLFPALKRSGRHSSRNAVARALKQPTRKPQIGPIGFPIWSCFEWGLPGLPCRHGSRWSLAPPFHPYRHEDGGLLSVALAEDHSSRMLSGIPPCEARTFLPAWIRAATARPAPET